MSARTNTTTTLKLFSGIAIACSLLSVSLLLIILQQQFFSPATKTTTASFSYSDSFYQLKEEGSLIGQLPEQLAFYHRDQHSGTTGGGDGDGGPSEDRKEVELEKEDDTLLVQALLLERPPSSTSGPRHNHQHDAASLSHRSMLSNSTNIFHPTNTIASSADQSSEFQIKSTTSGGTTGQPFDLCLEAKTTGDVKKVVVKKCFTNSMNQKWTVDEYGRFRTKVDENLCISKGKKSKITLSSCKSTGVNKNMFVLNAFEDTVNYRANGLKVFSVNGDKPIENKPISIPKRKYNKKMQQWNIDPSTLFLSKQDIPTAFYIRSKGNSMCIEASSLTNGSRLIMNSCNPSDNTQKWKVNKFGVLQSISDNSKCIVKDLTDLVIGNCKKSPNNMFMFDATDSSIVLKKGRKALSVSGDTMALTGKVPSSIMQQWSLDKEALPVVNYVGNPCTDFFTDGLCTICTGDCDDDDDCAGDLRCAQRRSGYNSNVPGCIWETDSSDYDDSDFCFLPISQPGIINYIGECDGPYKCGLCEGDCDSDSDCEGDLVCISRSGYSAVEGCTGEGGDRDMYSKDVCAPMQSTPSPTVSPPSSSNFLNSLTYNENGCSIDSRCSKCEGPCNQPNSCDSGLACFTRTGSESIPGCVTGGSGDIGGANYCYEEPTNGTPTYIPGDLTKRENGLILSTGLTATLIATTGNRVSYTGSSGGQSSVRFHDDPDAGAVFSVSSGPNAGGWIYLSNSEESVGGVGAITFDSDGQVIKYEMALDGTSQNCGGGKTYWGTWVTCEENGSRGQVWEVDPNLGANSQRNQPTVLGGDGGNYESFAYDARDRLNPTFYVTHDSSYGALVRFTPNADVVRDAEQSGDYSNVLTTMGTLEWLMLNPVSSNVNALSGTFSWTSNRSEADSNANDFYRSSEGIDARNGFVYFTTKRTKSLYILDLDNLTYERSSTVSGAFDGQPDQIKRIISDDPESDMLYFCEEASSDNGIHARDSEGNFYTIIDSDMLNSETTGLAFSPDNKHMYISYQGDGKIFDISREDGYPFGAQRLDIKYHAS